MLSEQSHEMRLETTYPTGAQEWLCPECGRRFVAQWEPKFKRVILVEGADQVIHKGQAISHWHVELNAATEEDAGLQDVWKDLLDKLDFGSEDNDRSKSP